VRITSPTSTTILQDSVLVEVDVVSQAKISLVELYVDSKIPSGGTFTTSPYKYIWDVRSFADSSVHTIYAKAYDAEGIVTTSPVLTVAVFKFTPTNLSAILVSDTLIRLTWNDISKKETGYEVEQKLNDGSFVVSKTLSANSTSADIQGIYVVGDSISFRVRAVADTQRSKYTNTAIARVIFPEPTNLLITSITDVSVSLSWVDKSTYEAGFEVEKSTDGGSFSLTQLVSRNVATATIADTFSVGSTYYYRIRALSTHNMSKYSNIASAKLVFPAPSNLRITSISSREIRLQWNDNSSFEVNFVIERAGSDNLFSQSAMVAANTTSWNDNTLDSNQTYSFRVRALTATNQSSVSSLVKTAYRMVAKTLYTLKGHSNIIYSLAYSPDGKFLASGSSDYTIKIWRVSDGVLMRTISDGSGYLALDYSPDGQILASGNKLWRVSDGILIRQLSEPSISNLCVAFSPDGQIIAKGDVNYTITIWRVSDGTKLLTLSGQTQPVYSIAFSPDGLTLASGDNDYKVKTWRTSDGTLLNTMSGHTNLVSAVAFSLDGQELASTGGGGGKIWRVSDGTFLRSFGGGKSLSVSPDGTMIAAGGLGGFSIYKFADGMRITSAFGGNLPIEPSQSPVAFSPEGSAVASWQFQTTSGKSEYNVGIWTLPNEWQVVP